MCKYLLNSCIWVPSVMLPDKIDVLKSWFDFTGLLYVLFCAIWYHLYNLKNVKSTYGRVLLLVKVQAEACNCPKSSTLLWVFFKFFKLCKWYQIAHSSTYNFLQGTIERFGTVPFSGRQLMGTRDLILDNPSDRFCLVLLRKFYFLPVI